MDLKSLEPILQEFMDSLDGRRLISDATTRIKPSVGKNKSLIPSFTFEVSPENISPQEAQSLYSISSKPINLTLDNNSQDLLKTKYIYEITGKVLDKNNGEPLEGARVKLLHKQINCVTIKT